MRIPLWWHTNCRALWRRLQRQGTAPIVHPVVPAPWSGSCKNNWKIENKKEKVKKKKEETLCSQYPWTLGVLPSSLSLMRTTYDQNLCTRSYLVNNTVMNIFEHLAHFLLPSVIGTWPSPLANSSLQKSNVIHFCIVFSPVLSPEFGTQWVFKTGWLTGWWWEALLWFSILLPVWPWPPFGCHTPYDPIPVRLWFDSHHLHRSSFPCLEHVGPHHWCLILGRHWSHMGNLMKGSSGPTSRQSDIIGLGLGHRHRTF